jgi:hypothetical protein
MSGNFVYLPTTEKKSKSDKKEWQCSFAMFFAIMVLVCHGTTEGARKGSIHTF